MSELHKLTDAQLLNTARRYRDEIKDLQEQLKQKDKNYNFSTHKNVTLVGDGELAYCEDCKGGESELYEQTCKERTLKARNDKLESFLNELWEMGTVGKLKTRKDERDLAQNMRNKIRAFSIEE